jgi:hypothetical protein
MHFRSKLKGFFTYYYISPISQRLSTRAALAAFLGNNQFADLVGRVVGPLTTGSAGVTGRDIKSWVLEEEISRSEQDGHWFL